MNYLAHLFLSRESPEAMTGGLLGDFVKGAVGPQYSPAVRAGILLHRDIDRFTDAHPTVRASRALVSPPRRRFAGILVDVFYDHFLARRWAEFCPVPLAEFTEGVYGILWPQRANFPERLQHILPHMRADDWLGSYAELWAVDAALNGIARRFHRFPRAAAFAGGVQELERNYSELENQFRAFFPELQRHTESRRTGAARLSHNPAPKEAAPQIALDEK